jgi:hypothetical protein
VKALRSFKSPHYISRVILSGARVPRSETLAESKDPMPTAPPRPQEEFPPHLTG